MATYGQLNDPNFSKALKALVNCHQEVSGSLATFKLVRFLEAEMATLRDLHRHIVNKFGDMVEGGDRFIIAEEHKQAYAAEMAKLYGTAIENYPFPLKITVSKLSLTPLEAGALEPFFDLTCSEN